MTDTENISKLALIVEAMFQKRAEWSRLVAHLPCLEIAKAIAIREGADLFIVELAALLHDADDWKLNENSNEGPNTNAKSILRQLNVDEAIIHKTVAVIDSVSFKGAGVETCPSSLESEIVQDADRLDAIGAIGIARTFAYGGSKGRVIHDPAIDPVLHASFEDYKKSGAPTINHFYEKLLLLKDRMNTETAKQMAIGRHRFMEQYLEQFYAEWDAEL